MRRPPQTLFLTLLLFSVLIASITCLIDSGVAKEKGLEKEKVEEATFEVLIETQLKSEQQHLLKESQYWRSLIEILYNSTTKLEHKLQQELKRVRENPSVLPAPSNPSSIVTPVPSRPSPTVVLSDKLWRNSRQENNLPVLFEKPIWFRLLSSLIQQVSSIADRRALFIKDSSPSIYRSLSREGRVLLRQVHFYPSRLSAQVLHLLLSYSPQLTLQQDVNRVVHGLLHGLLLLSPSHLILRRAFDAHVVIENSSPSSLRAHSDIQFFTGNLLNGSLIHQLRQRQDGGSLHSVIYGGNAIEFSLNGTRHTVKIDEDVSWGKVYGSPHRPIFSYTRRFGVGTLVIARVTFNFTFERHTPSVLLNVFLEPEPGFRGKIDNIKLCLSISPSPLFKRVSFSTYSMGDNQETATLLSSASYETQSDGDYIQVLSSNKKPQLDWYEAVIEEEEKAAPSTKADVVLGVKFESSQTLESIRFVENSGVTSLQHWYRLPCSLGFSQQGEGRQAETSSCSSPSVSIVEQRIVGSTTTHSQSISSSSSYFEFFVRDQSGYQGIDISTEKDFVLHLRAISKFISLYSTTSTREQGITIQLLSSWFASHLEAFAEALRAPMDSPLNLLQTTTFILACEQFLRARVLKEVSLRNIVQDSFERWSRSIVESLERGDRGHFILQSCRLQKTPEDCLLETVHQLSIDLEMMTISSPSSPSSSSFILNELTEKLSDLVKEILDKINVQEESGELRLVVQWESKATTSTSSPMTLHQTALLWQLTKRTALSSPESTRFTEVKRLCSQYLELVTRDLERKKEDWNSEEVIDVVTYELQK